MPNKPNTTTAAGLRHNAEARLRDRRQSQPAKAQAQTPAPGTAKVRHELEVHQIELELQNVELKKARDELEELLEKSTDLYDFAPMGYFSLDESAMILESNLTGAALLGVERSRLVNQPLLHYLSPKSRPVFMAFLNKVFTGQKDKVCESLLVKEGAGTFWASFRAASAISLNGTRKWCRVAFGDITERKQAEAALRESESHYRSLFDVVPVAVYSCDASGVIQEFNDQATQLWGRAPATGDTDERFCGSFKLFRLDGSFMAHEQCPMAEVVGGKLGTVQDAEVLMERPDGSRINVVVNIRPLKNDRGEVTGAINCFYDITARKHAEMAQRRLAAIVESSDDAMIGKDLYGIITSWNKGAEKIFGYTAREMVGTSILRLMPTARRHEEKMILEKIKQGESLEHFETQRQTKGGRLIDVSVMISPIRDAAGKVIGVSKVARDITERKNADKVQRRIAVLGASNQKLEKEIIRRQAVEESLKQARGQQGRLLEQSHQMQEQLRLLSHELLLAQEDERKRISRELHDVIAQTLTSINLRLSALKKEAELSPKGLEQSIACTQKLVAHSVNIVHRFARELRPAALDDLGLIAALQTFVKDFEEETGIHVCLSACPTVEQVNADKRTVLYRVAQEALTNVARHAQASRAEVKIQKFKDAICMEVIDNGKGLPAKRELQARKNKRMGLLGMRERVEMIRGSFTVQSTPGKSTSIRV